MHESVNAPGFIGTMTLRWLGRAFCAQKRSVAGSAVARMMRPRTPISMPWRAQDEQAARRRCDAQRVAQRRGLCGEESRRMPHIAAKRTAAPLSWDAQISAYCA